MGIDTDAAGTDFQEQADAEAVLRHAFHGEPLNPEVARRVHERATRVSEEIRRVHGVVGDEAFEALLSDDDGET
jgi:hypothetical protein